MRSTFVFLLFTVICLACLLSLGACGFERGDRYWSGKPQPIGIDFSSTCAFAVYADSPSNFTTLGFACPGPGNHYSQYVYDIFSQRGRLGGPVIIDDDAQWASESDPWYTQASDQASAWAGSLLSHSCRKLLPLFQKFQAFPEICFRDEVYSPKPPKSKYQNLKSHSRMTRLLSSMPRWFRTPQSPTLLTKSNFIMAIVDLLEEVKRMSLSEHNITITSAVISRPSWTYNDIGDLFNEACLLANIEVWEQPHNRVDIASKTLKGHGPAIIIDHGHYHMDVHLSTWDDRDNQHYGRESIGLDHFGGSYILETLLQRIIGVFNSNVTESERNWTRDIHFPNAIRQVHDARMQIRYGRNWPEDLEFQNRSTSVNLTSSTGLLRVLNMTGQDIWDVERKYVEEVSASIQEFVFRPEAPWEYHQGPDFEEITSLPSDKQQAILANTVNNVPTPASTRSWTKEISSFIILDSTTDVGLLTHAVQEALGLNNRTTSNDEVCVPSLEIAARGAALRALDWLTYWDAEQQDWYEMDDDEEDYYDE